MEVTRTSLAEPQHLSIERRKLANKPAMVELRAVAIARKSGMTTTEVLANDLAAAYQRIVELEPLATWDTRRCMEFIEHQYEQADIRYQAWLQSLNDDGICSDDTDAIAAD